MSLFSLYVICCLAVTLFALLWVFVFHRARFDKNYRHSLTAVSAAVEARSGRKGETEWVRQIAKEIAAELNCGSQMQKSVEIAAALCEIGLVSVPYQQLRRQPSSSWSQLERETHDRYPDAGASMLSLIPSLEYVAVVVRCQNAPYKSVAPSYLPSGDEIPIEARVLYVARSYVRAYADQGSLLARQTILDGSGTLFDPIVVDAALRVITSDGAKRRVTTTAGA